jgi:hypothetical protein
MRPEDIHLNYVFMSIEKSFSSAVLSTSVSCRNIFVFFFFIHCIFWFHEELLANYALAEFWIEF